jgi:sugar phosphate isomerase/epimerase
MTNINRRTFTAALGGAFATAALPQTRKPPVLGLDVYSLRSQQWTPFQVLDFCAKWNLRMAHFSEPRFLGSFEPENLEKVRAYAQKLNVEIQVGMMSICPTSRLFDRKGGTAEEQITRMVKVARTLGSPVLRAVLGTDADRKGPIEKHIEDTIKVLRSVRSLFLDNNMKIAIENHGGDMQGRELKTLIEGGGADFVGACLDSGNPLITIEDPHLTLETLAPYVLTSHVRDTGVWRTPKGAAVAWARMGDGNIGIDDYVRKFVQLCPNAPILLEIIVFQRARIIDYYAPGFWNQFRNTPAWEFARFLNLVDHGTPLTLDTPPSREETPARELEDLEKSVRYTRKLLDSLA